MPPKKDIRVLVVDDEPGMRDLLSMEFAARGYRVDVAAEGLEALGKLEKEKYQLMISDIKMPRLDGIALLEAAKKKDPDLEVLMTTGYGTIETAVEAMKKGAYDFIQKPFHLEEIFVRAEKALEKSEMKSLINLYEYSNRAVFSTIKLDALIEVVMDLIQKVMGADEGSMMFLDGEKKLYIAASRGIDEAVARQVHLAVGERVAGRAAELKKEFLLIDGLEKYPEFNGIEGNPKIHSSIVCPLIYRRELLGVLNLSRTKRKDNFTPVDLRRATAFAFQVSQAIHNAKLFKAVEEKNEELKKAYYLLEESQDKLVESEKLASIGRLMAGVAHELNNPLTAVIGFTHLLLEANAQGEIHDQLSIVHQEAERCRRIVQDLLTFSRRRKPHLESVDTCTLMDETLRVLAGEFKQWEIEVSKKYPAERSSVQADPHQLKQVFINILNNASHALQEISGPKQIEVAVFPEDHKMHIMIADNGPGIAPQNLGKIFEPFFTTKEVGRGTGLGLSLCYGIIQEHGGRIYAESEKGKGASFHIELPLPHPNPPPEG